jgi:NADH:ubiquinone oxidoreductase subunit 4 (subunit M)
MDFFKTNLLSIVAFWPLLGMFVLLFINKEKTNLIKGWANFVALAGFVISLPVWFWFDFDNADKMQ